MVTITPDLLHLYADADATTLARHVKTGDVSALELVETGISLIEQIDPILNSVVVRSFDMAREMAKNTSLDGTLAGVPFLLKNLASFWKGIPLTSGLAYRKDYIPGEDSAFAAKMREAGLIPLGRTKAFEHPPVLTLDEIMIAMDEVGLECQKIGVRLLAAYAVALEIVGRGVDAVLDLAQFAEPAVAARRSCHANSDIHHLAFEIDEMLFGSHFQLDVWMKGAEQREVGRQPGGDEVEGDDPDTAGTGILQTLEEIPRKRFHPHRGVEQGGHGGNDFVIAIMSGEEARAKLLLECLNPSPESRIVDGKKLGGTVEGSGAMKRQKRPDMILTPHRPLVGRPGPASERLEIFLLLPVGHVRQETADLVAFHRDIIVDELVAETLAKDLG